jgi:hypothetical protein
VFTGDRLDLRGQGLHLRSLVLTGGRHAQRQGGAQRIDGGMDLRALAPLVPTLARTAATLWRR